MREVRGYMGVTMYLLRPYDVSAVVLVNSCHENALVLTCPNQQELFQMCLLRACSWLVLYNYAHGNSPAVQVDCDFQLACAISSHYKLHFDITLLTRLLNNLKTKCQPPLQRFFCRFSLPSLAACLSTGQCSRPGLHGLQPVMSGPRASSLAHHPP